MQAGRLQLLHQRVRDIPAALYQRLKAISQLLYFALGSALFRATGHGQSPTVRFFKRSMTS